MKHKTSLFIALIALAVGVLMVIFNKNITSGDITTGGGVLFIAAGLLNILATTTIKGPDGERRMQGFGYVMAWIVSVASLALGASILIFEKTFAPLTPYVFAALVLVGAVILLYALAIGMRPAVLPAWLYIPPVLMVVCGIIILRQESPTYDHLLMIYAGVAFGLFGLGTILAVSCLNAKHRVAIKSGEKAELDKVLAEKKAEAGDAKPEEVKKEDIKPLNDNE